MRDTYPDIAEPAPEGGWCVRFPDVPEALSQGDTPEEVAAMAEDAPVSALSFHTDDAQPLPMPSPPDGRPLAVVPPLVALARRMGLEEKAVRWLRDPLHRSHIGQVDAALRLLGRRLEVSVLEST